MVDAGFIDLDILLTRIRHAQSKVYFLDAVKPTAEKPGASFMDGRRGSLQTFRPLDFRGDAAWTDSRAVAFAATSELWRRDSHTGSAFVTVSTAASIMEPSFTLPRCSLRMR